MSRLQDSIIDDDDDCCPLCVEEFDLGDKNFKPCPCGYQICQFCFNSLKITYESSTCPNCRRPYDEKTIEYKVPTAEEQRQDQLNKNKRAQAAKRKDVEKREVETSSRRNLAGVRVKQQNLVYVIGLVPTMKDEQALLQTLRGPEYFGQYGEVEKIVVSKAKPGAPNSGVGVYVTYARKEDAALCIGTIDGTQNGDRTLRAQFGTTKYCSAYLRGETCTNKNCSFLHDSGEDGQNSSLQGEPHAPKPTKQPSISGMAPPPRPQSTTQSVSSQPMARQGSKESDSRKDSIDGSALPSTASWANAVPSAAKVRRSSQSTSRATPSPQLTHAALASSHKTEKSNDTPLGAGPSRLADSALAPEEPSKTTSQPRPKPKPVDPIQSLYDSVLKSVGSQQCQFVFSDACLSDEEKVVVQNFPCMIDPFGGAKRRIMQDKEAAVRARAESDAKDKLEAQATSAAEEALEDENMGAGSLALGGDPEDNPRSTSARGAIGRPSQTTPAFMSDHFSNMSINGRSVTPQQRQQLGTGTANVQQAPGLQPPSQNTAFELSNFDRSNPHFSHAQYDQISTHQRHGSRYFNNESKGSSAARFPGQQQSFYSGGIQGPPPGLPASGTPPVSGGGMFAHGQNFTNPGFGANKDTNVDVHVRGRSGTSGGPDVSKRGGVEHLADPSIVQARIHQGSNNGQGLFGGQQVDETNFPPLPGKATGAPPGLHSRVASFPSLPGSSGRSTPKVPPGFENTHAHPIPSAKQDVVDTMANSKLTAPTAPVIPAVPTLSRSVSTKQVRQEDPKDETRPTDKDKAAEISLGSPKPRQPRLLPKEQIKQPNVPSEQENETEGEAKQTSPSKPSLSKAKETKPQKPAKIDIPGATAAAQPGAPTSNIALGSSEKTSSIGKPATPITKNATIVATPPITSSQPETPAIAVSETSRASAPRPRTLRVTTSAITKPVEPAPQSATTEKSIPASLPYHPLKSASRQASISSVPKAPVDSASQSRPSTPAMSEKIVSGGVSRASSPPPSILGSAPEKTKTKNQLKKERKEKAKSSGQKSNELDQAPAAAAAPTPPVADEVGPIVARQKKQKKKTDGKNEDIARPAPAKAKEEVEKDVEISAPATPTEAQQEPEEEDDDEPESPAEPYTVRDLYSELSQLPDSTSAEIQALLSSNISSMPKIISSLIASGDLARDHPWFHPHPFTSAAYKLANDNRKGQDYLDAHGYTPSSAFGYVYLPAKEKRALERGSAVGVAGNPGEGGKNNARGGGGEDLLKRCLITPNGVVYRHLTSAEGEKVLELEERRDFFIEEFGEDIGGMQGLEKALEGDDYINLAGGMEELGRYGERHGIVWVNQDDMGGEAAFANLDEDVDDEETEEEGLSGDETDDLRIDLDTGAGAWEGDALQQVGGGAAVGRGLQGQNVNLRSLDGDALQKRVGEKQKELEMARKEMEKAEKMGSKKNKEFNKWREGMMRA